MEKLTWLNQHYLKAFAPGRLVKDLEPYLEREGIGVTEVPKLTDIIELQRERSKNLVELARNCRYFYQDFSEYDAKAASKNLKPEILDPLTTLRDRLTEIPEWSATTIHATITEVAGQFSLKLGKIAQPLRVAVCGIAISPPIDVTVELIGRQQCLRRLERALAYIRESTLS